ncbi:hypothetical protein D3C83_71070 [compost metagenome]
MLLSAGRLMRKASGSTMRRYACHRLKPSDSAASSVVRGTASMPARKISTLKAPAKNAREITAQPTLEMSGPPGPVRRLPSPK